jgi:hypothetical protein
MRDGIAYLDFSANAGPLHRQHMIYLSHTATIASAPHVVHSVGIAIRLDIRPVQPPASS